MASCEDCMHFKVCYYRNQMVIYMPPMPSHKVEQFKMQLYTLLADYCKFFKKREG